MRIVATSTSPVRPSRWGALLVAIAAASPAIAGGGPENVLLVVNERSWSSLAIANHYIHLRGIPPQNVVYLPWTLDNERIDAATMREKLLGPIFAELERRKLGEHIDLHRLLGRLPDAHRCLGRYPSRREDSASAHAASFADRRDVPLPQVPAQATGVSSFRLERLLPPRHRDRSSDIARLPFLVRLGLPPSTARGRRRTLLPLRDARLHLRPGELHGRSRRHAGAQRQADYSRPDGTIYFAENSDIRSTTRRPLFASAVSAIQAAGAKAETFAGTVPKDKTDIAGAMLGSDHFSLTAQNCKLLPGAIGEHLTSFGGMLNEGAGQTPISEWVRAGTALTSGAVWEPFAVPFKFPSAYMHLHYVRGCTAGEAYYQSTSGPYQMLVLGDPLCKPWARRAKIELGELDFAKPLAGVVTFMPTGKFDDGTLPARFELFVDGLLVASHAPGEPFRFDVDRLAGGRHELRVTAVGPEPLELRSGLIVPFDVAGRGATLSLTRVGAGPIRWGTEVEFEVRGSGLPAGARIVVAQGTRGVKVLDAPQRFTLADPQLFGLGPITLQAFAVTEAGGATGAISPPLEMTIEPNELSESQGAAELPLLERVLPATGLTKNEPFQFEGFVAAPEDGVYQFHLRHTLKLAIAVDGRTIYTADAGRPTLDYVPIALKAGRHKVALAGATRDDPNLDIRLRTARRATAEAERREVANPISLSYAIQSLITLPPTPVSRASSPWLRTVSFK